MKQDDDVVRQAFDLWYAIRHPKPVHEHPVWAHAAKCDDYEVWLAASGAYLRRIAELEAELVAAKAPTSNSGSLPEMPSTPRYPDDSGEWVEVPEDLVEMPYELSDDPLVEILRLHERATRDYWTAIDRASHWDWGKHPKDGDRIVAYKAVKP